MRDNPENGICFPPPEAPGSEVSERIRVCCTSNLAPVDRRSGWRGVAWSVGISGLLFGALLTVGWLRHPPRAAVLMALTGAVLWGILQAAVLAVGHGRPPGRRGSRRLRWLVTGLVVVVFFSHLTLTSTSMLSPAEFLSVPRSLRGTLVCGIHSLLFGAISTVSLLCLWRHTDPLSPALTGALTGLAGGLVGAVAVDMVCTNLEAHHLWLGHGMTLVLLVGLGWLLGRRWLSP